MDDPDLATWHDLNGRQLVDLLRPTDGIYNMYIKIILRRKKVEIDLRPKSDSMYDTQNLVNAREPNQNVTGPGWVS